MLCKWCNEKEAKRTFCGHPCRNAWTRYNNIYNNPTHDPIALEKMRKAQTGKKASLATRQKMSNSRKAWIASNPELQKRALQAIREKYTNKIRGKAWRLVRLKALERDNYTCQECGAIDKRLLVHHKDYRGRNLRSHKDMNNDLNNLVTWCYKCHLSFHRPKSKDYRERMSSL